MNYQDYKDARDASWHILIDCKVTELPVRISGVCRALGVSVRRYTPAERDSNDGMSTVIGGAPTIMVSSLAIPARQRFTCAHELGHIILHWSELLIGAFKDSNVYDATGQLEREANLFGADLMITDEEVEECIGSCDANFFSVASALNIPAPFFAFKLFSMVKRGFAMRLPVDLDSAFLAK